MTKRTGIGIPWQLTTLCYSVPNGNTRHKYRYTHACRQTPKHTFKKLISEFIYSIVYLILFLKLTQTF